MHQARGPAPGPLGAAWEERHSPAPKRQHGRAPWHLPAPVSPGQLQGPVAGKGNVVLTATRGAVFSGSPWGGGLWASGARGTSQQGLRAGGGC